MEDDFGSYDEDVSEDWDDFGSYDDIEDDIEDDTEDENGDENGVEFEDTDYNDAKSDSNFNVPDVETYDDISDSDKLQPKKVLVIACIIGLILILSGFFIWSRVRVRSEQAVVTTVDGKDTSSSGGENVNLNTSTDNVESSKNNTKTDNNVNKYNSYIEVDRSTIDGISGVIKGSFNVLEIKTFAKVKDGTSGGYFRSVLYGNLTGMDGVYELEIPTESTDKVKVGDVVEVTYTTMTKNGIKYVVDIK